VNEIESPCASGIIDAGYRLNVRCGNFLVLEKAKSYHCG
jgi:hypothetical protein